MIIIPPRTVHGPNIIRDRVFVAGRRVFWEGLVVRRRSIGEGGYGRSDREGGMV